MKSILTKLILKLPESTIKNYIKFFYFNHFRNNDFKIYYRKKKFLVRFGKHNIYFNENPYIDWHFTTKDISVNFPSRKVIL